jgi:hypothetical protein
VHEYPAGTLAIFHGPRRLARYTAEGKEIVVEDPTGATVTPCLTPSRRGLARQQFVEAQERRPALTEAEQMATSGGLASGLASRRNWSKQLARTYTGHVSNLDWPGDARHSARRFS